MKPARIVLFLLPLLSATITPTYAMSMNDQGMVMNENRDQIPQGCDRIAADVSITVHAGRQYADKFPDKTFAFDQQEWQVEPCSRIQVTLINDDPIRHQFMVHGLPGYLYDSGMFHMELYGKGRITGTFIVPADQMTYLAHCEIPQHMEHGMKAQLKVGGGNGDLPSIPGISAAVTPDHYPIQWPKAFYAVLLVAIISGLAIPYLLRPDKRTRH